MGRPLYLDGDILPRSNRAQADGVDAEVKRNLRWTSCLTNACPGLSLHEGEMHIAGLTRGGLEETQVRDTRARVCSRAQAGRSLTLPARPDRKCYPLHALLEPCPEGGCVRFAQKLAQKRARRIRCESPSLSRPLRPKRLHHRLVRRQIRPLDQVDAVGNRREHRQQTVADGGRLARQIHDQRMSANARDLPRQDRRRHHLQRHRPHLLAETVEDLVAHGRGGLRRHVAPRRARAPRRHHQAALLAVAQLAQRLLDRQLLVGDQPGYGFPGTGKDLRQAVPDARGAQVLILSAAGAVADGDNADANSRLAHGPCLAADFSRDRQRLRVPMQFSTS